MGEKPSSVLEFSEMATRSSAHDATAATVVPSPSMPLASSSALSQILAGIVAGSATAFSMSPFDVARTRMQVQATCLPPHLRARNGIDALRIIYANEGIRGYFRGYSSAALSIPLFWASYFPLYSAAKSKLAELTTPWAAYGELRDAGIHSGAAIIAAVISDALTMPLWVARTRLQTQSLHSEPGNTQYTGTWNALHTIYKAEGTRALYKGLVASWLGASHVAIQFPLYEKLKRVLMEAEGRASRSSPSFTTDTASAAPSASPVHAERPMRGTIDPEAFAELLTWELFDPTFAVPDADLVTRTMSSELAGKDGLRDRPYPSASSMVIASTTSKLVAALFTYPHETIRARLQDQRSFASLKYTGIWDCATRIAREEGFRGLYSGFSVNLMRALPACTVTFFTYETALANISKWQQSL